MSAVSSEGAVVSICLFSCARRWACFVLDAHFVFWTAALFKTLLAQSFHFWPAAARRQALRSSSVPRTLTGNATRSPSCLPAKLFPFGAGILDAPVILVDPVQTPNFFTAFEEGFDKAPRRLTNDAVGDVFTHPFLFCRHSVGVEHGSESVSSDDFASSRDKAVLDFSGSFASRRFHVFEIEV